MNIEEVREYCISKKGCTEGFPFDEVTLVFKVMNKMFAILSLNGDAIVSLKCDPDFAIKLRETYNAVIPGYHLNKQQWNSIYLDGTIPNQEIKQWIDDSYNLIVSKLTKKLRQELEEM